eukprot:gnl/TRDRNA2_/TRDRNA2_130791_c0_seq1.p1 gnl/TRDRNA2_/TRDRNA2_130791_c0~~gnl/TRDRNA2_/TRDRNA2_130791_c0_seq1.p1  ORF type:complete len:775 (+),score=114.00 gnl/TRDRNA2_/TRDRNA2_130791_c0_seq1:148-2472(+)
MEGRQSPNLHHAVNMTLSEPLLLQEAPSTRCAGKVAAVLSVGCAALLSLATCGHRGGKHLGALTNAVAGFQQLTQVGQPLHPPHVEEVTATFRPSQPLRATRSLQPPRPMRVGATEQKVEEPAVAMASRPLPEFGKLSEFVTTSHGVQMPRMFYGAVKQKPRIGALIKSAVKLGFRGIDAPGLSSQYVDGVADALSEVLKEIDRECLFVQTRINVTKLDLEKSITGQVEMSIKKTVDNLGLTYVDSLLLHLPSQEFKKTREVWRAMEDAVQAGLVRQLGVAHVVSLKQLRTLHKEATLKPVVVQQHVTAQDGWVQDLQAWCDKVGVIFQSTQTLSGNRRLIFLMRRDGLAKKYDVQPSALLFRHAMGRGLVPVTGAVSREHMVEDIAASSIPLTAEDSETIERLRELANGTQFASVKVISYNVLSDSLCDAGYFNSSPPEDCDPETRLQRVKDKLAPQIEAQAVICLQEMSRRWVSRLIPFLEDLGYSHVSCPYGDIRSGYMGQMIAWPRERYILEDTEIRRVADAIEGTWPTFSKPPSTPRLWQMVHRIGHWLRLSSAQADEHLYDPWKETARRQNAVVLLRMRHREAGSTFVVGTYHMPALYGSDAKGQTMVAHAALVMQHAQRWSQGAPLIVAGDFNVKPNSPPYKMLTQGSLSIEDPQHPPMPAPFGEDWKPSIEPMQSAYMLHNAKEPDFTNKAKTSQSEEAFEGTLDYIWLSPHWHVVNVVPLPSSSSMKLVTSFPSANEPSDHLMIGADLEIGIPNEKRAFSDELPS